MIVDLNFRMCIGSNLYYTGQRSWQNINILPTTLSSDNEYIVTNLKKLNKLDTYREYNIFYEIFYSIILQAAR